MNCTTGELAIVHRGSYEGVPSKLKGYLCEQCSKGGLQDVHRVEERQALYKVFLYVMYLFQHAYTFSNAHCHLQKTCLIGWSSDFLYHEGYEVGLAVLNFALYIVDTSIS